MTRILVIEDDRQIRINIVEVLSYQDYTLFEAENGLVGVQVAKECLPDLIICDINMPEMDGYEVLQALRDESQTATIPFIFLTAQTDKLSMRHGMDLGADDYLTKPFSLDELLAAIKARFEKHALLIKENEQKLNTLRGNILHALPHELRTPLTGILGAAELIVDMGDMLDRDKIIDMVANILESGQRLYHLTENYLLYAQLEVISTDPQRIEAVRQKRVNNPSDVIIKTALQQAAPYQRENDLVIESDTINAVQISSESLEKIAAEIVENALKFSQTGTPIEIEIRMNDALYLRVTDYGRGMTAEQIKNIAPYIQFDRKLYEQQGSGLGLAIVRRLAELHGGQLLVESIRDESTTVIVTLPLA